MNRQGIREQVKALLNRNDCSDALANTFIDQGLSRIQRTLRVPDMEKQEVYTMGSTYADLALPSDFLNIKYLYSGSTLLEFVDIGRFLALPNQAGTPKFYTRVQQDLKISPQPAEGTEITMIYYGKIPQLTSDSSTNFLSDDASDLLIYSSLTFAADYFVDERKAMFEERYAAIYGELEEQSRLLDMDQSAIRVYPAHSGY